MMCGKIIAESDVKRDIGHCCTRDTGHTGRCTARVCRNADWDPRETCTFVAVFGENRCPECREVAVLDAKVERLLGDLESYDPEIRLEARIVLDKLSEEA